uniref:DEAD/DEAH-box helicase domain-containing protein n=1 Tax=Mycena chlorophos TaxID=658473 RepID=A0ABQ0LBW1_MYCCL|nr:predicted protein [Mycena chlorophos]
MSDASMRSPSVSSEAPHLWDSPTGRSIVNRVVQERTSWEKLRPGQEEPILRILDGKPTVVCTATSSGKSALFTVPIMVQQEISKAPEDFPEMRGVRPKAVGIVITPTKGLARNIADSLCKQGVRALAYDRETIAHAARERIDLTSLISSCEHYDVICVDPEHLGSKDWIKILESPIFCANLSFVCVGHGWRWVMAGAEAWACPVQ